MRQPEMDDFDTEEDYLDAMDNYEAYCDYHRDAQRDDSLLPQELEGIL